MSLNEATGVPTLAELGRRSASLWLNCKRCLHHAPVAFVPLMIRWGADTSSNKLRRCARCTVCGHKGATPQHPSWLGSDIGFAPFAARQRGNTICSHACKSCEGRGWDKLLTAPLYAATTPRGAWPSSVAAA